MVYFFGPPCILVGQQCPTCPLLSRAPGSGVALHFPYSLSVQFVCFVQMVGRGWRRRKDCSRTSAGRPQFETTAQGRFGASRTPFQYCLSNFRHVSDLPLSVRYPTVHFAYKDLIAVGLFWKFDRCSTRNMCTRNCWNMSLCVRTSVRRWWCRKVTLYEEDRQEHG